MQHVIEVIWLQRIRMIMVSHCPPSCVQSGSVSIDPPTQWSLHNTMTWIMNDIICFLLNTVTIP